MSLVSFAYGTFPRHSDFTKRFYNDYTWAPLNQSECAAIGGSYERVYEWRPANWRPGVPRRARTVCPESVSRYEWQSTVDLTALSEAYYNAIGRHVRMLRKGYSLCRFRSHIDALEAVGCACSPDSDGTCFSDQLEGGLVAAATSEVCAGSQGLVVAPSCTVEVERDAIEPLGACARLSLTPVSALEYHNEHKVITGANFLNFSPDTTWRFANENDALVGQVDLHFASVVFSVP